MGNTNLLKSIEDGRALIETTLVDVQKVMKNLALTSTKLSNAELLIETGVAEDDAMTEKEVAYYNFLNRNFTGYVLKSFLKKKNTAYTRSIPVYDSKVEKLETIRAGFSYDVVISTILSNFISCNIDRDNTKYITIKDLAMAINNYLEMSDKALPNRTIRYIGENIATCLPFDEMIERICAVHAVDNVIRTIDGDKCIVGIAFMSVFTIHKYMYTMGFALRGPHICNSYGTGKTLNNYNESSDIVCDTEVISETSSESHCLTGDTMVATSEGFKPVNEVKAEEAVHISIEPAYNIDPKEELVNSEKNEEIASFIKDERKTKKLTKRKWAEDIHRKIDLSASLLGVTEKSVYKSIYDGFRTIYGIDPRTEAIRAYNDGLIAKPNGFEYIASNKETRSYFVHLFDELIIKTRINYAASDFLRCYEMTPTQKLRFENRIFEMVTKTIQLAVATGVDAKDISIMIRNNVVGYNSFRSKFKFNVLNAKLSPYIVIAYDDKKYNLWMRAWKKEMGDN